MLPLVSVLMSVYNAENYIEEAIESILNQTYLNLEFIIIDDGSTDGSLSIIERYKSRDERVVVVSRENRGLVASLNEGIALAKGKYIARMDADDISLPSRIEEQVNYMERNLNVGVCGSWVEVFGDGRKTRTWKRSCSNEALKAELLFSPCFTHPSVMIRKSVLVENGFFYDDFFQHAEDYALWVALSMVTDFHNIGKVLLRYRVVNTSVTRRADKNTEERYRISKKLIEFYTKKLCVTNSENENVLHFNIASNIRVGGQRIDSDELKRYFCKISLANSQQEVFDKRELDRVLSKRYLWFGIIDRNLRVIFSRLVLVMIFGRWVWCQK